MFVKRVVRRIFELNRDEVTGGWRKLHNEDLYSSPIIIRMIKSRRIEWIRHVARIRAKRNAYRLYVGKTERNSRPLRGRRWWAILN
jgi:hypothetical protein